MYILTMAGRLDEAERLGTELLQAGGNERPGAEQINYALACLQVLRGNVEAAREHVAAAVPGRRATTCRAGPSTRLRRRPSFSPKATAAQALDTARSAIDEAISGGIGVAHEAVRFAFPVAVEAAIDLGDAEEAESARRVAGDAPTGRGPTVPPGTGHPRQGARRRRTR